MDWNARYESLQSLCAAAESGIPLLMDTVLLVVVIVLGLAAATAGYRLMRSSGGGKARLERPPIVEHTDAHGRLRIIDRWVYLALELCRVDGAIDETEIAAVEKSLTDAVIGLHPEEATKLVDQALRATIRQSQVGSAIEEIGKHADAVHRAWVVEGLQAVALADSQLNREEELFLTRVRQELGL